MLIPELVLHPQNSGVAPGLRSGGCGWPPPWEFWSCGGSFLQWTGQGEGGSVAFLYGVSLVFQAAEPLGDWFRSRLQSRWPALISCAAAVAAGLCQLGLLLGGAGVRWFALAHGTRGRRGSAPSLILAYSRGSGKRPLRWDSATARTLWNQGRHFLLSGLLVALYGQTDRLMLRSMAGRPLWACTEPPGPSSALWIFVPAALVETARPLLLARFRQDPAGFRQGWPALYGLLWYGSCLAALVICLLSRPLLLLLYGQAYCPAWGILCVAAWRPAFSCLGIARSIFWQRIASSGMRSTWLPLERQSIWFLNLLLIPLWGPLGAALATLLAQAVANVGMNFSHPTPPGKTAASFCRGCGPIFCASFWRRVKKQIHGRRPPHTRELLRAIIRRLHWVLLAAILGGMFGFLSVPVLVARLNTPPQAPSMSPSPAASLPIPDRLRGPHRRSKAGQDLLGSPGNDRVLDLAAQQLARTAPQRTCGLWSPHPAWGGHGSPLYFCLPTETLRLPRSLPTPSWTPPRLEILRIVHRKDRGSRPGRSAGSTGCPYPWHAAALAACITGFSAGLAAALAEIPGEAQAHSPLRRRVYVDHGGDGGRAD